MRKTALALLLLGTASAQVFPKSDARACSGSSTTFCADDANWLYDQILLRPVYSGVTSNGSNGLAIVGGVDIGTGEPTLLGVTPLTVSALQALASPTTNDLRWVSNGATASDCTVGGGGDFHQCRWTGSAWVATTAAYTLPAAGASTLGGVRALTCSGTDKLSAIGTDGIPVCTADQNSGGAGGASSTVTGATTAADPVVVSGVATPAGSYVRVVEAGTGTTRYAASDGSTGAWSADFGSLAEASYTFVAEVVTAGTVVVNRSAPTGIALAAGTGINTFDSTGAGGGAISKTFSVSDTNTTLLLASSIFDGDDPGTSPPTVTDGTVSWTLLGYAYTPAGHRTTVVWKATSAGTVASHDVTVTWPRSENRSISIVALKGASSLGAPVARSNENHLEDNTVSVTTTVSNSWVVGFGLALAYGASPSWTADTTLIGTPWNDGYAWLWAAYKATTGTGTYTLGATNQGGDGALVAVEVKP